MKQATTEQLHKAHVALEAGKAMKDVLTPEFGATIGLEAGAKLTYSQVWLHHRRHEVEGTPIDFSAHAANADRARVEIVRLTEAGCSWGEIAVRLGCGAHKPILTAEGRPVSESWVRRLFEESGVRSTGLRIAKKGGRWLADEPRLYNDEVGRGEARSGVTVLKAEPRVPALEADPQANAAAKAKALRQAEALKGKLLGQPKPRKGTAKPKPEEVPAS